MDEKVQAPDIYLIGLPKAGTTSLYDILTQSSEIYNCSQKEPNYFLPERVTSAGVRQIDAYNKLYETARASDLKSLDASVSYCHYPETLRAILNVRPDAKFILCLRRPETLAASQYVQMRYVAAETCKTFDSAWLNRINKGAPKEGRYQFARDYPRSAAVGKILETVLQQIPRESLHLIIFEEFLDNSKTEMDLLCEFLDIATFPFVLEHKNSAKELRFPLLQREIMDAGPMYRFARTILRSIPMLNTQKLANVYFRLMQKSLEDTAKPSSKIDLADYFAEDKRQVEKLIGRDIPLWWPSPKSPII